MKMKYIQSILFAYIFLCLSGTVFAERVPGLGNNPNKGFRTADACVPPSASAQLDVNNVRCLLHNGGDMWWDLVGNPRYEIPKGSGRHSLFASSLWIGGTDAAGQMRVAASTYRQSGYDFWPGPLTQGNAEIDNTICEKWNKMYKITKSEIDAFRADFDANGANVDMSKYPNVASWPWEGKDLDGNNVQAFWNGKTVYMAPFVDVNGNPLDYKPEEGDYPDIRGDEAIWWVINDKGNIHTETGGEPIGVEIHMMAFAFTTANSVNNMTFYDQLVINRSSLLLTDTYMGQWVDADLGYYKDDYVGCDTVRGLGICYNSDNDDNLPTGYGQNPPAVGVDFFQGPLADPGDGIDNDKDGVIDEDGETISMSKFVYYNNDWSLKGNPETAVHYYNFLKGIWKDGTRMVANGKDAYAPTAAGDPTNYIFSGDICNQTGWTETTAGNGADDRRFLQSAGPFTLQPGAVNQVITGVVWARGSSNLNSVCQLIIADDVAQALFDNNFRLLEGPDAPEVAVGEYDNEIILTWGYSNPNDNNYNESYVQADPILKANGSKDSLFKFQGYVIYQLANSTVGLSDINDPSKAKIIAQCDIIDNVSTVVNRVESNVDGNIVIEDKVMVQGDNKGIFHSLRINTDVFATNEFTNLKNYTPYTFAVIAYAYGDTASDGRRFVPGNGKFARSKVIATPHPIQFEQNGTTIQSKYGEGITVSQIGGYGNGGNFVRIDSTNEASIIANNGTDKIVYQGGAAPISVKVVNPKEVKGAEYRVEIVGKQFVSAKYLYTNAAGVAIIDSTYADWVLYEGSTKVYESKFIQRNDGSQPRPTPLSGSEQVIPGHGISVSVRDVIQAGDTISSNAGIIGSELIFNDLNKKWLTGLPDDDSDPTAPWNWILAGSKTSTGGSENRVFRGAGIYDKFQSFEKVIDGTWSPFCFAREFSNSSSSGTDIRPGLPLGTVRSFRQMDDNEVLGLNELTDFDLVITPDENKWTRCVVVETSPNTTLGSGAWLMSGKWKPNVDKAGNPETPTPQSANHGMGWFPGYAINVNTGQRLCVFFGESTWDHVNRGDDMRFNPTSSYGSNLDRVGGRHYIYITDLPYTGTNGGGMDSLRKYLLNDNLSAYGNFSDGIAFVRGTDTTNKVNMAFLYNHVAWTSVAMTSFGYDFKDPHDFPTDARVSIRLNQQYKNRVFNGSAPSGLPTYTFNTGDKSVKTGVQDTAVSALDIIQVVPNPYYGYSNYEGGQLESVVKITNLPQKCTVSIFSLNGQLIKTFNKDSNSPEQLWDLKNQNGVPVASGAYIVHINAPGLGEKVVKLFAVMRQLDLNGY